MSHLLVTSSPSQATSLLPMSPMDPRACHLLVLHCHHVPPVQTDPKDEPPPCHLITITSHLLVTSSPSCGTHKHGPQRQAMSFVTTCYQWRWTPDTSCLLVTSGPSQCVTHGDGLKNSHLFVTAVSPKSASPWRWTPKTRHLPVTSSPSQPGDGSQGEGKEPLLPPPQPCQGRGDPPASLPPQPHGGGFLPSPVPNLEQSLTL